MKVIDVNDVMQVIYLMEDLINVYHKISIDHVRYIKIKFYLKKTSFLDPSQPSGPDRTGGYYIDQQPYDVRGTTPLNIVLDGNQREQRIPLQVLVCD